ncbi:MAG: hypothetical protein DRG78_01775 [Epsilonproteobacteria bacterium]|nr:MAG: hypothetical protein DRG78_01775 [Campylobacterota bacterium]
MKKININYYEVDKLIQLHNDKELNYTNIGFIVNHKLVLSDILYYKYEIKKGKNGFSCKRDSLIKNNIKYIQYIIEYIEYINTIGVRKITIAFHIKTIKHFIHFLNKEKLDFIDNINTAKEVFEIYSFHLAQQKRQNKLISEAQKRQSCALKFLIFIFNDKEGFISSDVQLMRAYRGSSNGKEISNIVDSTYAFNFYTKLFNQLSDFILNFNKYPFQITLERESLWIIPVHNWISPSFKKPVNSNFDYKNGTLINGLEYEKSEPEKRWRIRELGEIIHKNNLHNNTKARLELGRFALKAYFMHFLTLTGMNDSTASNIMWNSDSEVIKDGQKFKAIKYRANNKPATFQIKNKFFSEFTKFLKLRDFLLQGNKIDYLFFDKYGKDVLISANQKHGSFSSKINRQMRTLIDNKLPTINSKELRVNKSNFIMNKYGIAQAAQMLNNSITTTLKHYTGESQESSALQLSNYFDHINTVLVSNNNKLIDIPSGQCKDFDNPKAIITINNFDVSCTKNEGCLFCEHYRVHADEIDIRKLYSLLYIINESRYLARDDKHFNTTYGLVIERINDILKEISKKLDSKILKYIKDDVFNNENLHPYWEHKLSMLISLGVLV